MKDKESKNGKQKLNTALGAPKYFIDTPGLAEGETYAWFPTRGDSMTDNSAKSIPSGSLVLGRCLKLNSVADIPLHRPIVVSIDDGGFQFCMLKSGCQIKGYEQEEGSGMLCLRSYNPSPRCDDFWMPFGNIKFVFVVERVRLPNGEEFEPRQEEVIRQVRN